MSKKKRSMNMDSKQVADAFTTALRLGLPWLRWAGVAAVAVALALRFLPRPTR